MSTAGTQVNSGDGVCCPRTASGCDEVAINGTALEWSKGRENAQAGKILKGNALGLGRFAAFGAGAWRCTDLGSRTQSGRDRFLTR